MQKPHNASGGLGHFTLEMLAEQYNFSKLNCSRPLLIL
jgi:hypothetical protein